MDNQTLQNLINALIPIVVAIAFAFVAGGATVATLIALVIRMVLNSPVILSTIEKLYQGLDPKWKEVIKGTDEFLDKVTDDIPTEVPAS